MTQTRHTGITELIIYNVANFILHNHACRLVSLSDSMQFTLVPPECVAYFKAVS